MKHPVYSQIFSMGNAWRCYFWTHSTLLWLLWIGSSASSTVFWHSPGNNSQTKLRRAGPETPEHMRVMLASRLACEKTSHGDVTGSHVVIAHTGAYWTSCQVQSEWSTIPALCSSLQWIKQTLVPGSEIWDHWTKTLVMPTGASYVVYNDGVICMQGTTRPLQRLQSCIM